jgi:predicted MPP superfamily phosphohydrolase
MNPKIFFAKLFHLMRSRGLTYMLTFIIAVSGSALAWRQSNTVRVNYWENQPLALSDYFYGMKIVHLSDLHTRAIGPLEKNLVRKLKTIKPDLIFITGDFVNSNHDIPYCGELLRQIQEVAPTVAVLGNHDHWFLNRVTDTDSLKETIRQSGVTLLVNESMEFKRGDETLYIIGLDDNHLGLDDYALATRDVPEDARRIVLAHSPEIAGKLDMSNVDLILSGHNHDGQIKLPLVGNMLMLPFMNHSYGFFDIGDKPNSMYVTSGIGTTYVPMRLGTRAEIAVFDYSSMPEPADVPAEVLQGANSF